MHIVGTVDTHPRTQTFKALAGACQQTAKHDSAPVGLLYDFMRQGTMENCHKKSAATHLTIVIRRHVLNVHALALHQQAIERRTSLVRRSGSQFIPRGLEAYFTPNQHLQIW